MKVYLAGPMTGLPMFNFPAFDAGAERLRARGWDVVSPAELDSPEHRAAALGSPDGDPASYNSATGETWGDLLARDVKLIADEGIQAVVVLPGWHRSRGARLETFVASALCGLPVYGEDAEGFLYEVDRATLAQAWTGIDVAEAERAAHPLQQVTTKVVLDGREIARAIAAEKTRGGEVRVTNAKTGGEKGSKPQRFDLLPWNALGQIAEVYAFGASKYADHNWRKGYDWSLSQAALARHVGAFWEGQDTDPESGLSHIAHAGFHVLALLTFMSEERYAELDDRYRAEAA